MKYIIIFFIFLIISYTVYTFSKPKIYSYDIKTNYYGNIKRELKKIPTQYSLLYQIDDVPFIEKQIKKIQIPKTKKYNSIDVHDSFIQQGHSKHFLNENKSGNEQSIESFDPQVKNVLNQINSRNNKMVLYNMESEMDVIQKTFNNGDTNVKNQIVTVLKEIESEGLMCPTGVVTRIREASFINHPENMPVTKSILQQQMLHKAASLNEKFQDYSKTKQALLNHYSHYPKESVESIINEWNLE